MKTIILVLLLVTTSMSGFAQTIYRGMITDSNNVPLIGVNVMSILNKANGTTTDSNGHFEITLDDPGVLVSHVAFSPLNITLNDKFNQIVLKENTASLTEVVVTGNRESQNRSEVPAAIDVIGSRDLTETKAFGIDQIVNQVPGVFMMTSRAGSNEQHMMAVRSPISTNALFLYLEDGLQIRPTSVFNHNALLEMNDLTFSRVEVLKGPASSIYGSESIGGSFNFITKKPTKHLTGSIGLQGNDLGLSRYDLEISSSPSESLGYYLGAQYVQRHDGPIQYSDYEKFAVTFKTVYDISERTQWTNVVDVIDYRSDMTGSLSKADYQGGNFESDQTFTERDAVSFRVRSTIDTKWNNRNKTSFNMVFRDNRMDQNPSYLIRQFRDSGQLTGFGSGEINSNQYNSYMALVQHKINWKEENSSLIFGATSDLSPQDYVAERTDVTVDPTTGRNMDFSIRNGEYVLNYEANILNFATYSQYEISPLTNLKVTAALRYDSFSYDYRNRAIGVGVSDSKDTYDNLTPKLGINYNFNWHSGVYANYSQGFTPPQVSTLYRNRNQLMDIKPSIYENYEIGGYFNIAEKLKLDGALYILNGKNTLIGIRDNDDVIINTNAGQTSSYGLEYGITYWPSPKLSLTHNGSYARHRYIKFFENGVDYSDTDRETAPRLLGISKITYRPLKNLSLSAEHELVGSYNTSFEGQVDNGNGSFGTASYGGHNIINLRAIFQMKHVELWMHALNVFDELYAAQASYSSFSGQNSYTIGNPFSFHGGIRYLF